jgi:hypothetical protein
MLRRVTTSTEVVLERRGLCRGGGASRRREWTAGRWLELDAEAALTAPMLDLAHWSELGPRDA